MKNPLQIIKVENFFNLENKICAEIGVQKGEWAKKIYECGPQELYLIDCWEYQNTNIYENDEANVSNDEQEKIYNQILLDFPFNNVKIIRKYSADACNDFPDEFFDFIYLDANHNYVPLLNDLRIWFPKIKKGGWFTGHDIRGRWKKPVRAAVTKFCVENKLNLNYLTRKSWGFQK